MLEPRGFAAFYAALSFHEPSDAAFAATLYETWALGHAAADTAGAAAGADVVAASSVSDLLGRSAGAHTLARSRRGIF